jgi:glycosyltransferase involved in cell wall biosynthesis
MGVNKVCLLTEGFYPPGVGGQQKHAHMLTARLAAMGQPVFVVTRQADPPAAVFEQVGAVPVIRVAPGGQFTGKGWAALVPLLLFLWRVLRVLWALCDDYDTILVLGLKTLPLPALLAGWLFGKRCVIKPESPIELWQDISAHSLESMGLSDRSWLVKAVRVARYALVRRADRVVALSTQMRDALFGIGIPADRIELIPNGIDVDQFSPVDGATRLALREKLGLPLDEILFTFAGRLTTSKGLPELLEVWRILAEDVTQDATQPQPARAHLVLVGSGDGCFDDCESGLRQYTHAHEMDASITFGGVTGDVHEYLQASDAFVFPSHYEGFGLAVVEAMACSLPVVSTRVGVASEVIQDRRNGLLVEPKDAAQLRAQLRDAILWLLDHPAQWAELGATARNDVVARYSIDAVAARYAGLFAQLRATRTAAHSHAKLASSAHDGEV